MRPWQRRLRGAIGLVAIACAVVVAFTIKRRPEAGTRQMAPIEPSAISKVIKGMVQRFNKDHEDVRVDFDESTSYADGSTRLLNPTITTERSGGRIFTITSKEAQQQKNGTDYDFVGNVRVTSTDGLALATARASYTEADGTVRAPGPVQFTRGRASGSGIGFTYNKNTDVLIILERPSMRVMSGKGEDAMDVTSGSAELNRPAKTITFDRDVHTVRGGQTTEADAAVAVMTADDEQLEMLKLRGHAVVTGSPGGSKTAGSLKGLRGDEVDLQYGPDGRAIETAAILGGATVQMTPPAAGGRNPGPRQGQSRAGARSGARSQPDAPREIAANAINITMAPDGTTPVALGARDSVKLTVPADGEDPARTIEAPVMNATGDEAHGLTRAHFTGGVLFREQAAEVNRTARSEALDITLAEGMAGIEEAVFGRSVRFEDGAVVATAATAKYDLARGFLALTGSSPTTPPRVEDDRITINATSIDLTLEGPKIKAVGNVISELKPAKGDRARPARQGPDPKVPSMLKSDQPVIVTAESLDYDGDASHALYSGNALLVQEPTRIKAKTIAIDDKSGDLSASGDVFTIAMLQQKEGADKKKERTRSSVTAQELKYEEALRRATYSGGAHMVNDDGDMTAPRIELFLKESGDEIDRAEAHDGVKLVEQGRRTSGTHLVYTSADEKYQVTGKPVSVVNRCGDETKGLTLTLFKSTDKIIVDGNDINPTTTTGRGTSCP